MKKTRNVRFHSGEEFLKKYIPSHTTSAARNAPAELGGRTFLTTVSKLTKSVRKIGVSA